MKYINKKNILSFVIGAVIFGCITVVSAYTLFAPDIGYTPTDPEWEVENVKEAIDDLYDFMSSRITKEARKYLVDNNYTISLEDLFSSINFCSDAERFNSAISNIEYARTILNSTKARTALDSCSPVVSTDTSKAYASSSYSSTYYPRYAFDNDDASYWGPGAGISYQNQSIGYDFTNPVWVYKMVINMSNGKQNTDYVLEASNDKSIYTIIKSGLHQGGGKITVIPDPYTKKYRYYRIRMLSTVKQSGEGNTIVSYLRFYAK